MAPTTRRTKREGMSGSTKVYRRQNPLGYGHLLSVHLRYLAVLRHGGLSSGPLV